MNIQIFRAGVERRAVYECRFGGESASGNLGSARSPTYNGNDVWAGWWNIQHKAPLAGLQWTAVTLNLPLQ